MKPHEGHPSQRLTPPVEELRCELAGTPYLGHMNWRSLYRIAVFETQNTSIHERVSEAETAVLTRIREIFGAGGLDEEKEELEDALHVLRAFRWALEHGSNYSLD